MQDKQWHFLNSALCFNAG